MIISDKFFRYNAKSKGFGSHDEGDVAFISNGFYNNGVVGFVTPLKGERVFNKKSICVSSFCEATVQEPPFLPRGNGGSGLIVLTPKNPLSQDEFYFYSTQINKHSWRFSFGRMVTVHRISTLCISEKKENIKLKVSIENLLPKITQKQKAQIEQIKEFPITNLCTIERKYAPYLNKIDISKSRTPYVTTTENNNGIAIWCNESPLFKKRQITVSLDGLCGTTFYQFDDFISGEKTAVLDLKNKNNPYLIFYIATMIRKLSWRYHYGRKLSMGRLLNFQIPIPVDKSGNIDNNVIKKIVCNCYGSYIFEKNATDI